MELTTFNFNEGNVRTINLNDGDILFRISKYTRCNFKTCRSQINCKL